MQKNVSTVARASLSWALLAVVAMSCVVNVLALAGAFYMLQVYDRVLTSQSIPTLVALSVLVAGLYAAYGILDVIRSQLMLRIGSDIDAFAIPIAYASSVRRYLEGRPPHDALQPVRDVDTLRNFLASSAPVAVADLPWTPIFLIFVSMLSPMLGLVTAGGMAMLVAIAIATDFATRRLEAKIASASHSRSLELDATLRNSEAIVAMGMSPETAARFLSSHHDIVEGQRRAGDAVILLGGISRVIRLMLQSAILGLGAYLVIRGEITTGAIVAASIAAARALAPVEQAITNWRALAQARDSARRLRGMIGTAKADVVPLPLPPPSRSVALEQVVVRAPGSPVAALNGVTLVLEAGQGLAVIGTSGSGKSTLARTIAGIWSPVHGTVRLDGAPIGRWDPADRGRFIGYMPQNIELFPASITKNIARLDDHADSDAVVAAAKAAGIHQVILNLPHGYETELGTGGAPLSAGQRQQIGLARALYQDPFLVVLDEPNANLDQDGEEALIAALQRIRERGGIAVVVAHRRSILAALDTVAIIENARMKTMGPKADVLRMFAPRIDPASLEPRVRPLTPAGSKRRTAP